MRRVCGKSEAIIASWITVALLSFTGSAFGAEANDAYLALVTWAKESLPQDVAKLETVEEFVAIFSGRGQPTTIAMRRNAALNLAESIEPDRVPLKECERVLSERDRDLELGLWTVLLISKGLFSETRQQEADAILFRIVRDRQETREVRSMALETLLDFSKSKNSALCECKRILNAPDASEPLVWAACRDLVAAAFEHHRYDMDLVANCILEGLNSAVTDERKTVLLEFLEVVERHNRVADNLNPQTLTDIHHVGEQFFIGLNETVGNRLAGLSLLQRNITVSDETIATAKSLVSDPHAPLFLKPGAERLLSGIRDAK
jgi:hypothetical protein